MNAITKQNSFQMTPAEEAELMKVLESSLYPGASQESIRMVIGYCQAAGLDPMQKPVHIVPIWDSKAGRMRDVVMPGIGLYRIQAARGGDYAGVTEPEYGPDVTENIGGTEITYPSWCKVIVKRRLADGMVAEFAAIERWKENYAQKGGKEKSTAPNAMWTKRPYGQIAKCAEAQALRKAFPEIGSQPTAEEMEGKQFEDNATRRVNGAEAALAARSEQVATEDMSALIEALENVAHAEGIDAYATAWKELEPAQRKAIGAETHERIKAMAQKAAIDGEVVNENE